MHQADAPTGPGAVPSDATGTEDTLELRLTEELLALLGDGPAVTAAEADPSALWATPAPGVRSPPPPDRSSSSPWNPDVIWR